MQIQSDMIHLNSDHDIFCSTRLWGKFSKICINLPKKMHKHKTCTLANKQLVEKKLMDLWWAVETDTMQIELNFWVRNGDRVLRVWFLGQWVFINTGCQDSKMFYSGIVTWMLKLWSIYVLVSRSFGQNLWQLTRLAWNVNKVNATYMLFILLKEAK